MSVLLTFWQFSSEPTKTWSSGSTECRIWIGNCNVKVWKSTEHKLHKIWRCTQFQQNEHTPAPCPYWWPLVVNTGHLFKCLHPRNLLVLASGGYGQKQADPFYWNSFLWYIWSFYNINCLQLLFDYWSRFNGWILKVILWNSDATVPQGMNTVQYLYVHEEREMCYRNNRVFAILH